MINECSDYLATTFYPGIVLQPVLHRRAVARPRTALGQGNVQLDCALYALAGVIGRTEWTNCQGGAFLPYKFIGNAFD